MSNWEQTGDGSAQLSVDDALKWDENFYHLRVGGETMVDELVQRGTLRNGDSIGYGRGLFLGHRSRTAPRAAWRRLDRQSRRVRAPLDIVLMSAHLNVYVGSGRPGSRCLDLVERQRAVRVGPRAILANPRQTSDHYYHILGAARPRLSQSRS